MTWQDDLNDKRLKTGGWYGCIAPDGWKDLIEETDRMLSYLDPDYEINQIKEKFGALRYYFDTKKTGMDKKIMLVIASYAEYRSMSQCEVCGNFGELRTDQPWLKTLCDKCNSKREVRNINE